LGPKIIKKIKKKAVFPFLLCEKTVMLHSSVFLWVALKKLRTPGVNFNNILRAHFSYKSLFKAKLKAEKSSSKDFRKKNERVKC